MPKKETNQCSWTGCERTSTAKVSERALCLEHFLEVSRRRVESIKGTFDTGTEERNLSPEVQTFLTEVISQTTLLAMETRLMAPRQRDDLIELSTTAAEIYKRIQRAPRIARRVCCLVSTGLVSKEIPEKCYTINVSRRGACIEIRQALRMGQPITLERVDTRRTALAKVAWTKPTVLDRLMVGVEILDEEDFWGLAQVGKSHKAESGGTGK